MTSNQSSRRVLRVLIFNISILVAAVTCLELIFGRWLKTSPLTAVPEIARTAGKQFRFRTYGITGEDVEVVFSRDSNGLRGLESADKPLILVLGGSTGVEQNIPLENTWAELIEHGLLAKGYEYEVANASISGHTLFGNQYALSAWLSKIPILPNKFIVYYGHNDAVYTMDGQGPDIRDFSSQKLSNPKDIFVRNSALAMLLRELKGNYKGLVRDNSHIYDYKPSRLPSAADGLKPIEVQSFESLVPDPSLPRDSIRGLVDSLNDLYPGIPVILVAQSNPNCRFLTPSLYLSSNGRNPTCERLALFHEYVRAYISSLNQDNFFIVPLYLRNPYDRSGSSDSIHTNSRGAAAIAREMLPELVRILKSIPPSSRSHL